MKFSIIVPVYGVEEYLSKCVESILNQTFKDFELILVNDGSPDRCPHMCDEYAAHDSRVKVVHKKNGGLTSARKAGLKIASGDFIVVVDSDDWVDDRLLEHLHESIEKNGSDVVCYNHFLVGDNETPCYHQYREGLYTGKQTEDIRNNFLYDSNGKGFCGGGLPNAIWTKCVKRALYKKCQEKVPDEVVKGEDLLFSFHLLSQCPSIYMMDYIGYYYRVNPSSITHTIRKDDIDNIHKLAQHLLENTAKSELVVRNSIYAFSLVSVWSRISGFARQIGVRSEYVRFMKEVFCPDFDSYFRNAQLSKPSLKDKLKQLLLRKHMWNSIYWIATKEEKERT